MTREELIKNIIFIANTEISETIKPESKIHHIFLLRKIAAQRYLRTNDAEHMELMLDYVAQYNEMITNYFNL